MNVFPPKDGGRARVNNIAKYLSRSHELLMLQAKIEDREKFDIDAQLDDSLPGGALNHILQIINPKVFFKILHHLRNFKPDYTIVALPWHSLHVCLLRIFTGAKIIYDSQNVESQRFLQTGYKVPGSRFFLPPLIYILEFLLIHLGTYTFVVSEDDRRRFIKWYRANPKKLLIVRNGFSAEEFYPDPRSREILLERYNLASDSRILMFVGSLDYAPNKEAVDVILEKIVPVLKEKDVILIAGRGEEKYKDVQLKNVIFTGFVEKTVLYYQGSDLQIVPLSHGGGTRFKILEAIGCGSTVLSTRVGAEGIDPDLADGKLIVVEDNDALVEALEKDIIPELPNVRPEKFTEEYSWESIIDHLNTLLENRK